MSHGERRIGNRGKRRKESFETPPGFAGHCDAGSMLSFDKALSHIQIRPLEITKAQLVFGHGSSYVAERERKRKKRREISVR